MRIDFYTKAVLSVIAVFLMVIAFGPFFSPESVAHAQGSFAGVQASGDGGVGHIVFFDSRTGGVWIYDEGKSLK